MIWLSQYLCERRHCMIAGGWDDKKMTASQAEKDTLEGWQTMIASGVPARCRICGSEQFHFETRPTIFNTMELALPFLRKTEQDNINSGNLWEALAKVAKEEREKESKNEAPDRRDS